MTKTTEKTVFIPAIDIQHAAIKIVGDSPLIVHKWSEKAKKEILDMMRCRRIVGVPEPGRNQCKNHCRFFSNFCCQFYFRQIFNCFDNIFRPRKRDAMRVCGHFRRLRITSLIFGL